MAVKHTGKNNIIDVTDANSKKQSKINVNTYNLLFEIGCHIFVKNIYFKDISKRV